MEQVNNCTTMTKQTDLIKDLEELTQRMPWGTVERGETGFYVNGLDRPCYMPYGIESIVRAISELTEFYSLKEKMNNGEFSSLPIVAYSTKEHGYRVFWQSKGHYFYSNLYRDKKEANRKANKIRQNQEN